MDKQNKLGEEKIIKLLISFSTPAIIGMVVNTLYNIVDRMFIGHIPGEGGLALTGVGLVMPVMTIVLAFGMLVGIGTAARISLDLGKGKRDLAEKHLGNAFILILIISITITVIGLLFKVNILEIFGGSESTIPYAEKYMTIILGGTVFSMLSFGLNHSIRSDGSPKVAMWSMLIGAGINIILDPIFIFVLNMGVEGAALATVISQLVATIWILYYFTKGKSNLKIKKENFKLEKSIVLSIFAIGISPCAVQIAQSVVQIIANNSLKAYGGDLAIGAMAIIASISMIFLMPVFGLNQGAQPILGYNYGAKQYDRVRETAKYTIGAALFFVVTGFILIQCAPVLLINIFNKDPKLVDVAVNGLRVFLFMLPLAGVQVVMANFFQAVGKSKIALILSLLRQVIILIPMMLIIPRIFGLQGVWLAGAISDFASSLITITVFIVAIKKMKKEELSSI